jgi:hypothetical protein
VHGVVRRGAENVSAGPGSVFYETHWKFLLPTRPGDRITGEVE